MKKINHQILAGALLLLLPTGIFAQIYTQDADGKSSIIAPGSSINFDFKKEALSINWNNWQTLAIDKKNKPMKLWGVAANAANENGLGNILSEGNFVPSSRLNIFWGIRKKIHNDSSSFFDDSLNKIEELLSPLYREIIQKGDYKTIGISIINSYKGLDSNSRSRYRTEFRNFFSKQYEADDLIGSLYESAKNAREKEPKDLIKGLVFESIAQKITFNETELKLNRTKEKFDSLYDIKTKVVNSQTLYRERTNDKNILFYINGGINSSVFRLYDNTLPGTLKDQVVKTPYTNGFIEVGVNYDIGARWLIGATFGYEKFTTFDSLDNSDVVLRTTTTNGNQSLIEDKKYTVYTGDFFKYDRLNIKFDALYFGKISDSYRYAWNVLYGRFFSPFGEKKPKGIFNLGTAFNFHKKDGKFLGGIYCEAIDVNNNMGADTDFTQRINIGIVATFSFGSIISYLDK